ncbi:MAG: iron-containing alcohol dehydrogenase [Nitrospinota bacterium]|nr:iron-containing alcohol dehydrogenase [Nitrospinota bacterium]
MKDFLFHNPTRVIFGRGKTRDVGELTSAHLGEKVLLVLGRQSAKKNGLHSLIVGKLAQSGVLAEELWGVAPNPSIESVREGARIVRDKGLTGVLAVGGGSVIDCAKAIAAAAWHDGDPWELFEKKIKPPNVLPIGCVLTLAATGSEANGNSVISNPATEQKLAWYHPEAYPAFSILDPELTFTLPPEQTAYGAVDILSHVYEQFFHNLEGTDIQDGMAITLMRSVIANAPVALANPDDYDARASLMWASTLALNGLIGAGAVGDWTCHMLEHELSAKHDLAHGAGLAVIFPSWMRLVAARKEKRFRLFLERVWDVSTQGVAPERLGQLTYDTVTRFYRDRLSAGVTMKDYGVDNPRVDDMVTCMLTYKTQETLGGLTRDEVVKIFQDAA